LKAWREAADKLGIDAKNFPAERHDEVDAVVRRMNADAAEGGEKTPEVEPGRDPVMVRTYGCPGGNARRL